MYGKILVVDDSAEYGLIIKNMFCDYNVVIASDISEAVIQININKDIELIILNHTYNMDYCEIATALKLYDRYKNLYFIVLVDSDDYIIEMKGLELREVNYIIKSAHTELLKARINVYLELIKMNRLYREMCLSHDTLETILNQAPIGIAITHSNEPFDYGNNSISIINHAFEKITGRSKEELRQLGWNQVTHPDDLEEDIINFQNFQSGKVNSYSMEKRYIKKDGSSVWVYLVVAKLNLDNDYLYNHITIIQDISERKAHEEMLKYVSEHDTFTGLYNRKYLEELLARDNKKNDNIKRALININLSKTKSLAITYGFQYSQELIKKVANILLSLQCNENCQLFLTFSNRFTFYIKNYNDKSELIEFCNTIIEILRPVLVIEGVGVGLGILEINDEKDVDKILKNVLIASENALKKDNRYFNYTFFDKEMEAKILRKMKVKSILERIAAGGEGIFVQFQPIFDLKCNCISGFEALTRIKDNELGLILPEEFIPVSERTRLIIPIGKQVLYHSLKFLKKIKEKGFDSVHISVNISAIQLFDNNFSSYILELLDSMDIKPESLVLEITESIFLEQYYEINKRLGELKSLCVKIAIDDFGTGYSSFSRIGELNVNFLKVDKYFIDKLIHLTPQKIITSDIISMSHKLGYHVVAEGVEYEIQKQYLIEHNCDMIQGYLISRPFHEEDALNLLRELNK